MNKIKLTLLITLFDLDSVQINNWIYIADSISHLEQVEIVFANDNPKRDVEYSDIFRKYKYINSITNKGKYKLVMDTVKNGYAIGQLIKVCDPDDLILMHELELFINSLENIDIDDVMVMFSSSLRIDAFDWDLKNISRIRKKIYCKKIESPVNENVILSKKHLLDFDLDLSGQTKSSDFLLSLSTLSKSDNSKYILKIPGSFYVYNVHKGISSMRLKMSDNDAFNEMNKQFLNFLLILKKYKSYYEADIPSFWDYKWYHNFILRGNLNYFDRIKMAGKVFEMISELSGNIEKKKFSKFSKVKNCYIKQFLLLRIKR